MGGGLEQVRLNSCIALEILLLAEIASRVRLTSCLALGPGRCQPYCRQQIGDSFLRSWQEGVVPTLEPCGSLKSFRDCRAAGGWLVSRREMKALVAGGYREAEFIL